MAKLNTEQKWMVAAMCVFFLVGFGSIIYSENYSVKCENDRLECNVKSSMDYLERMYGPYKPF